MFLKIGSDEHPTLKIHKSHPEVSISVLLSSLKYEWTAKGNLENAFNIKDKAKNEHEKRMKDNLAKAETRQWHTQQITSKWLFLTSSCSTFINIENK